MKTRINKQFKIKFNGCENVENHFSQAGQDVFVLSCLNGKKNGTFLDLGSNDAEWINNTILLESQFGWRGISIDINPSFASSYEKRISKFLAQDCTKLNWNEILNNYTSDHIDYLSLDLEPASVTYNCLTSIPLNKIEFSIITYEHDSYRFGQEYVESSRKLIESFGYKRICSDVMNGNNPYEDWYYNPKFVSYKDIKTLETTNKEWSDIIFQ
jgi:hypothetical protein